MSTSTWHVHDKSNPELCDLTMKNIYDVLRQKENEIQQLQKDIEALRVAARLLADDNESESVTSRTSNVSTARVSTAAVAASTKPADTLGQSVGIRQFP